MSVHTCDICRPSKLQAEGALGDEMVQALEAHLDVQVVSAVPWAVRHVMHSVPLTYGVNHWDLFSYTCGGRPPLVQAERHQTQSRAVSSSSFALATEAHANCVSSGLHHSYADSAHLHQTTNGR